MWRCKNGLLKIIPLICILTLNFLDGQVGKESACSMGELHPLEKEMATHSSILTWRISWTEEPGGLPFMGSQRVKPWVANTFFLNYLWLISCVILNSPEGTPGGVCRAWGLEGRQYLFFTKKAGNIVCLLNWQAGNLFISLFLTAPWLVTAGCWAQPRLTAMDCHLPGSSGHGIFQARILEWIAISYFRGSSWPRDWIRFSFISCIGRQIPYH